MRYVTTALFIIYIFQLGCGTTSGGADSRAAEPAGGRTTHDGLVEVETEGPGKLFLREDHGIGGYDAVAVVPSWVAYSRSSAKLKSELEDVYLASLEQTIWDLADDADISIVRQPGDCVLMIGAGFVNVDLAKSSTAKVLGNMVLVIEFQDSTRKQSLLRYAAPQRISSLPCGRRLSEGRRLARVVRETFSRRRGCSFQTSPWRRPPSSARVESPPVSFGRPRPNRARRDGQLRRLLVCFATGVATSGFASSPDANSAQAVYALEPW
jgi:hypothetical protein